LVTIEGIINQGFSVTVDILGEHVQTVEESQTVRDKYCRLYEAIENIDGDCTISLKLTHLGLDVSENLVLENLSTIVQKAREVSREITIDMENSELTDITLNIYKKTVAGFNQTGTVLQAYLFRSLDDLKTIDSPQLKLRICKGIYREHSEIAFQNKDEIRNNFITLVQTLLNGQGTAQIATHDPIIIESLENWIEENQIPPDRFEFQVLYGVPMGNKLDQLRDKGWTVRIYVPFGAQWFDYSVRRLKENPKIIGYVLGNLFKN
jgi:proline dehydrogenase